MPDTKPLGKLIAVHGPSPVSLQRAAVVALVSFVFFLTMLLVFYVRQHIGYFILATAFLIVNVFTMIGWLMLRRNVVEVFELGLTIGKISVEWDKIAAANLNDKTGLVVSISDGGEFTIPRSIAELPALATLVRNRISSP